MLVDDEPAVLRAFAMLLRHDGHEVQAVDSGEAALAMLDQRPFDLIITDFSMAGMKGDQLVALIRQRRPDQPIIVATAFAEVFKIFGTQSGGVELLLEKPFTMAELREAIDRVLPGKSLKESCGLDILITKPPTDNFRPPAQS